MPYLAAVNVVHLTLKHRNVKYSSSTTAPEFVYTSSTFTSKSPHLLRKLFSRQRNRTVSVEEMFAKLQSDIIRNGKLV